MRVLIRKGSLRAAIGCCRWALGAAGVLLLGYCVLVLGEERRFQREARLQLAAELRSASHRPPSAPLEVTADGLIGRIEIARLGISVMVVEGVDARTLRHAAGHIPRTALPGQSGNVGISAHRDTFFRPLRNIHRDDVVSVTTAHGEYRYHVTSTRIVSPADVAVLEATEQETLTLVTCYPFYFVGPAPKRFVVRAERVL